MRVKFVKIEDAVPNCEICERQLENAKTVGTKRVLVRTDMAAGEIVGVELC